MKEQKPATPQVVQSAIAEEESWFNERLLKTRTVLLNGGVNDMLAQRTIQSLLMLEADAPDKPIDLFINSPGGSVTAGFGIYDVIRYIKPKVRCVSSGLTASIATIILVAVDKKARFTLPNSRILIHQPLLPFTMFGPASDLEITANEMSKTRQKLNQVLADACGHPVEKVVKDTMRDYWMSAQEAMDYGLVGRVINNRSELV